MKTLLATRGPNVRTKTWGVRLTTTSNDTGLHLTLRITTSDPEMTVRDTGIKGAGSKETVFVSYSVMWSTQLRRVAGC